MRSEGTEVEAAHKVGSRCRQTSGAGSGQRWCSPTESSSGSVGKTKDHHRINGDFYLKKNQLKNLLVLAGLASLGPLHSGWPVGQNKRWKPNQQFMRKFHLA